MSVCAKSGWYEQPFRRVLDNARHGTSFGKTGRQAPRRYRGWSLRPGGRKANLINPSYFNLLFPIAIAAHYLVPIRAIIPSQLRPLGWLAILAGLLLNLAGTSHLRRNHTPVDFAEAPRRLVTDGPFRFSRNPIYLGGIAALLGLAVLLGSLTSMAFPVLLFLPLHLIYIPSEERGLFEAWGIRYAAYQQRVGRWISVPKLGSASPFNRAAPRVNRGGRNGK